MPFQRDRYPRDWDAISRAIRYERAGNRCEWCGVPNGEVGFWAHEETTYFRPVAAHRVTKIGHRLWWKYNPTHPPIPLVRIVLTVAHLGTPYPDGTPGNKHDKMDVRPENLAALCQKCHLNYDRADHLAHAAETRRRKRLAAGQLTFIE